MKPDWKGWKAKAMTTWFASGGGFYSGMRYRKDLEKELKKEAKHGLDD